MLSQMRASSGVRPGAGELKLPSVIRTLFHPHPLGDSALGASAGILPYMFLPAGVAHRAGQERSLKTAFYPLRFLVS